MTISAELDIVNERNAPSKGMSRREADERVGAGLVKIGAGAIEEARILLRGVLDSWPEHPQALSLMGTVEHRLGNLDLARDLLERARALEPTSPQHASNLGAVLCALGRPVEAERLLRDALVISPAHPEARLNLGAACAQMGRFEEALASFDRASSLRADFPEARLYTAMALARLQRTAECLAATLRYLELKPDDHIVLGHAGSLCGELGMPDKAALHLTKSLRLNPDAPNVRMTLLVALCHLCAWEEAEPYLAELRRSKSAADVGGWVLPFFELSMPLPPERLLRDAAEHYRATVEGISQAPRRPIELRAGRRVRVGYVSADFREHPMSHLIQGHLSKHDRENFEVFLYSIGPNDRSDYRRRIESNAEHFVDLAPLSMEACVERIRGDEIDVLVDLMGYTAMSRIGIFAHRCAPIQVTYMGYAGSLGADCIDYQLVDRTIVPGDLAPHFTERLAYLPDTYMVTDDEQPIGAAVSRAECALPEDAVVFSCFNGPQKIEPEVFDSWMRIMAQVPNSVLWLIEMAGAAMENLRRRAAAAGIAPSRLVFAMKWKKPAHLSRVRLADIVLDTFYFGAHTTAVDALWAGVPIITCPGQTFASRVGASVLKAMGLPELIAADRAGYEALAVELALSPEKRRALRDRVAEHRDRYPLFDTERFTRHVETAFRMMIDAYQRGAEPRVLDVPPLAGVAAASLRG